MAMNGGATGNDAGGEVSRRTTRNTAQVEGEDDTGPVSCLDNLDELNVSNLQKGAFVANLGTFLFGMDVGITSWLVMEIAKRAASEDYGLENETNYYKVVNDSDALKGLVAAMTSFGSASVYMVLLFAGNDLSKKFEMQMSSWFYMAGATICFFSCHMHWDTNQGWLPLTLMLVGRYIFGFGFALTYHSVPEYLTEITPKQLRGRVGASIEVGVVSGCVFGQLVGYMFLGGRIPFVRSTDAMEDMTSWANIFAVILIISVAYSFAMAFLPTEIFYMLKYGWTNLEGKTVKYTKQEVLREIQFLYPRAHEGTVAEYKERFERMQREVRKWQKVYDIETQLNSRVGIIGAGAGANGSEGESRGSGSLSPSRIDRDEEEASAMEADESTSLVQRSRKPDDDNNDNVSSKPHANDSENSLDSLSAWFQKHTRLEVKILFADPVMKVVLCVATGLKMAELLCGQGPFIYTAGMAFQKLVPDYAGEGLVGITIVKAISAISMLFFTDHFPRRVWLLLGQTLIVVSQLCVVGCIWMGWGPAAVFFIYTFMVGFEIGFGALYWVILNEINPKFMRSASNSVVTFVMFAFAGVGIWAVPGLVSLLDMDGVFLLFSFFSAAGLAFTYLFVPETRGIELTGHVLAHEKYAEGMAVLCCAGSGKALGVESGAHSQSMFDEYDAAGGGEDDDQSIDTAAIIAHRSSSHHNVTRFQSSLGAISDTGDSLVDDSDGQSGSQGQVQ